MNSPPANFFRLSTDQFAERDRIEAARELIGRSLMKMEFDLLPDVPFNVEMVFRVLPDFGLASGTCSAMDCLRTSQMIESTTSFSRSHCPAVAFFMYVTARSRSAAAWP